MHREKKIEFIFTNISILKYIKSKKVTLFDSEYFSKYLTESIEK
jgi:hypothetical protein